MAINASLLPGTRNSVDCKTKPQMFGRKYNDNNVNVKWKAIFNKNITRPVTVILYWS